MRSYPILSILIIFSAFLMSCSGTDFNSEKWKNWSESEAELFLRWDMRDDLLNNHDLKGKSTEEIIELLGEPENKSDKEYRYFLGHTGKGINTGSLILTIKNDTVRAYSVFNG